MALDIVVTSERYRHDPVSRQLVEYLNEHQKDLALSGGVLYYDFPSYSDYETSLHRADILVFAPCHGFLAIRFIDDGFPTSSSALLDLAQSLDDFCGNLGSRLLRSRELRASRNRLIMEIQPVIYDASAAKGAEAILRAGDADTLVCSSLKGFADILQGALADPVTVEQAAEVRSIVEGAKALTRPAKRVIDDPNAQPLAAALAQLEAEIANFDQKQRRVALVDVGGPARIRGLAGSGKTVILAMKAAYLHLNRPDDKILVTFYTRSLRATLKTLITKFYRHYSDVDPDWDNIHIRHGWGSSSVPGVYSDTCRRHDARSISLDDAKRLPGGRAEPSRSALQFRICSRR